MHSIYAMRASLAVSSLLVRSSEFVFRITHGFSARNQNLDASNAKFAEEGHAESRKEKN